jgi:hypothetical protein
MSIPMRYFIISVSLLVVACSLAVDFARPSPDSRACKVGACRIDQIVNVMSSSEGAPTNFASLVSEDPANPFAWCTYADYLSLSDRPDEASAAFDHAIDLGPNMPPVLMRAANFDFTHGRVERALPLSNRILADTPAFDEILFSYLTHTNLAMAQVLGAAVPASPRPAQAWLAWIAANGSDSDVSDTWSWMKENRLLDQKSSEEGVWALWRRKSFDAAHTLWSNWPETAAADPAAATATSTTASNASATANTASRESSTNVPQLLHNCTFQQETTTTPFDWSLVASPSVGIAHSDGLEIRFSGAENAEMTIQQFTTAHPGRYEFSAQVATDQLTTDQRPFFQIFDAAGGSRLDAHTPPLDPTMPKGKIVLDFTVPPGTEALAVQLLRSKSERFDNKISGTLHVYSVSLLPVSSLPVTRLTASRLPVSRLPGARAAN